MGELPRRRLTDRNRVLQLGSLLRRQGDPILLHCGPPVLGGALCSYTQKTGSRFTRQSKIDGILASAKRHHGQVEQRKDYLHDPDISTLVNTLTILNEPF